MKKIITYFFNKDEEVFLYSIIKDPISTDSYIVGEIEDDDLKQIRERGIIAIIDEQKDNIRSNIYPNNTNDLFFPEKGLYSNVNFPFAFNTSYPHQSIPDFPDYFIITLNTPLLESYRQELNRLGVTISSKANKNNYVVLLTENVVSQLKELKYITDIEHYTAYDTDIDYVIKPLNPFSIDRNVVITNLPNPFSKKKNLRINELPMIGNIFSRNIFDVILHQKDDLSKLLNWLEQNQIKILGYSQLKIRIEITIQQMRAIDLVNNKFIRSLEEYLPPKLHNDLARQILKIDDVDQTKLKSISYKGEGQIIAVADTGIDETHPAFNGRIQGIKAWGRHNNSSDPNGHGTHVAASIVGTGDASLGTIKGTAPEARLFFQSILKSNNRLYLPVNLGDLFQEAYDENARIHNNSWGAIAKSRYTASSLEVDDFVWQHPDMLLIFSAGNDGKSIRNRNVPIGYTDLLSLGSPATSKNALTVGASRSTRTSGGYSNLTYGTVWQQSFPDNPTYQQNVSGNSQCMAAFSSRGPVDDERRIKPDIVAPGTDIASALSKDADLSDFCGIHPDFDQYAIMCGTSMSAPLVAGCAAIVREYLIKEHLHQPSAALLKAMLVNSTNLLSDPDANLVTLSGGSPPINLPYYHQGFGLLNMQKCIPDNNSDYKMSYVDSYTDDNLKLSKSGMRVTFQLTLYKPSWIKITMAYTDPPGRGLQNNVFILLSEDSSGEKWAGNHFMPRMLSVIDEISGVEIDQFNNVQTIHLTNTQSGSYKIKIIAHNLTHPGQDYSFVVISDDKNFSLI